ncbi:MAG: hypothetical protein E7553_00805 [Ruminococcaceae bacterium]|nr:hypothetical protein [Oscillospiraceae bacterium]
MALFNLRKIAAVAAGQQTYLRGIHCYNSGYVRDTTRTTSDAYAEIMTADVWADNRSDLHHCEICFDYDGTPVQMDCSCPVFNAANGACKHLVALLAHKYYADMVNGSPTSPAVQVTAAKDHTDDIAANMIRSYTARESARFAAQTEAPDTLVRLYPELCISGQSARLSFCVGGHRDYILRDLHAFSQAMASNDTVSYGKELTFFHHPDSFAPEDRALLRFLLGQIPTVVRGTVGGHAIRELTLTPVALDAFFSLMREREVRCRYHGKELTVTLLRGDPSLTLCVSHLAGGCRLEGDSQPITLPGTRRRYVLTDSVLYGCSTAFSDRVGGLLDALQASHGSLFIADKDMPAFCGGVLRAVDGFVTLTGDTAALDSYRPAVLEAELYLDAPAPDTIAAKLLFCYGDRRLTAFTDEDLDGINRDTMEEYRIRFLVKKHFPQVNEQDGRLILQADDDAVYRFMTEGLAALQQHAAVYVTERVKAIGVAPAPRIAVGVRMQSDLLDLSVISEDLDRGELEGVLTSYREKRTYHRLKNGQFLRLDDPALQGLHALTEGLAVSRTSLRSGNIAVPAYRALYIDRVLRDTPSIHLRRDENVRRLIRDINAVADNEFSPPQSLDKVLRNYQKTGFRWLKTVKQYGFGGILADDMGLGKTVQMISLLLDAKEQGETQPSLVVCPASLVYNWRDELSRFAPTLRTRPVTGDKDTRVQLLSDLTDVDVLITSYDLIKRDHELYVPHTFAFHILDEAQYIKNANTLSARVNKAVKSRHRFALTGTPIENRLSELWSIFDFLMPGFLFSYPRFRERFERPVMLEHDEAALARLDKMVSPFILRRLKKDVLSELPDKHEAVVRVPLTGEQRALYAANVQLLRDELTQKGLSRNHITVLSMLTRLRQICCSPALCYEHYRGESAKIDACSELIREAVDGGHKVLLFSQFTSLLDLLKERLTEENVPFYELRGSTPKEQRGALVEEFNRNDVPLFLISLKAGGTGLNLTGADVVIHFDPWWNLSAQNQATDRAHRIGQTRTVQVYKLIASDTIEEKILTMQSQKQALADAVVHEGEGLLAGMSADDLLHLLD